MFHLFIAGMMTLSSPTERQLQMLDSVWAYIQELNIKHPEVVLRQAILESGWFSSPFLMKRNNIFAFRNKDGSYKHFDNWRDCVVYYKNWQERTYTREYSSYYQFLVNCRYARNPDYVKHLRGIRLKDRLKTDQLAEVD